MPFESRLRKLLHRKAWESCCPIPAVTAAASFIVSDDFALTNGARAFAVISAASVWMYEGHEDSWIQLPASGIAGVFAAGACGEFRGLSAMGGVFTQTATGGTTTTLVTNRTIVRKSLGSRVRVVAGTGIGYEGAIADVVLGANAVITVTPANSVAFDSTTQFQVYGGSLWFFNSGTAAVGFSVYDLLTNTWAARSVVGLPTAWGTDAKLVSTAGAATSFATGTATAGAASTLTNAGKAWATNMWANSQVRITGGTGQGQIRTIASNTGTVLTVSAAWTVNPDATSTYEIEGNDDLFYLLGNNAVTMYRYSVAANAWTTLAPVAARAGAPGAGMSANWIESVAEWANVETAPPHFQTTLFRQNGRYIYSFRGAAGNVLDVYDIAANTWVSGVPYGGQTETFGLGSSAVDLDGAIYIHKEATGRIFRFDVHQNRLMPLALNTMQAALGGAAVLGDKLFILPYSEGGTKVSWLYAVRHSGADMSRMLLI